MTPHGKTFFREESGFSLIELMIYLAILGILMTMVFVSFIRVTQTSSRQSRIADTKIEVGVGLDLLRADLEHAGFGLPWDFQNTGANPYFEPADAAPPGAPAALADVPNIPRAVSSEDSSAFSLNASDYLAIKGLNVVRDETTQRWGWVERDAAHGVSIQSMGAEDFEGTDRVIVVRPQSSPGQFRQLIMDGTSYFAQWTTADLAPYAPPETANDPLGEKYLVYGIDDIDPRRPFNRTDYYINNANVPQGCAPNTGVLVKATLNQANDNFLTMPIVDCVADFQVVYHLDTDGDGGEDTTVNAGNLPASAEDIRNQVKSIRCYILTHEGGIDSTYTHPNANINVGEVDVNGTTLLAGRLFPISATIGSNWANYRWKVYSLAITPRNLK